MAPAGWADVATTRDLEVIGLRIDRLGDQLRSEFSHGLRMQLLVILGFNLSLLSAFVALFR